MRKPSTTTEMDAQDSVSLSSSRTATGLAAMGAPATAKAAKTHEFVTLSAHGIGRVGKHIIDNAQQDSHSGN